MQLGKYEILEELGQGGFGVVYKAHDTVLDVMRAVKVLHPALVADTTFLQRFKQEARLAARLEHPNLVPVYDFAEAEGRFFLAMKYMPGKSLKDLLSREGKLEQAEALELFRQVCEGVAYAHQQGVVHRDLKPGNVLIDADGSVRVSDMGFAKAIAGSTSVSMSATGAMIGTPPYMAPEIWRGKPATPASDQYSLACILYEMLTGEVLFDGESPADVMTRHVLDAPSFSDQLPEGMRGVLQTALAKDPSKRFHDLAVFTRALQEALQPTLVTPEQEACSRQASAGAKEPVKQPASTPPFQQPGAMASAQKAQAEKASDLSAQQPVASAPISIPATGKASQIAGQPQPERNRIAASQAGSKGKPGRWAWGVGVVAILIGVLAVSVITVMLIKILGDGGDRATITPTNTTAPQHNAGDTRTRGADGMEMVYIPAGSFTMGSEGGDSDEDPVHKVSLDAFWMDKYEVSNAQYKLCVDANACDPLARTSSYTQNSYYGNSQFDNYPVIYVSWYAAQAYCAWAGGSLPTEAQWEYAARGTDGRTYPWGKVSPNCDLANAYNSVTGSYCVGDTTPVNSYPAGASPFGVFNMAGNVWEWVADRYGDYSSDSQTNPTGPTRGNTRVLRGGSWYDDWFRIRAANRHLNNPDDTGSYIGFRCVSFPGN